MLRDIILDTYRTRFKSIKANYRLALEGHDVDGVHDLRVDIKRMRALFNLVEALNSFFHVKANFKPFRKIAKNTGVLRDAQVQLEMLNMLTAEMGLSFNEYASFLDEREQDGWQTFHHFAGTSEPLKKCKATRAVVKAAFDTITDAAASARAQGRFYNLRNELIILSSEKTFREEVLHDIRKLAKTAHYTLEIIGPAFPGFTEAETFIGAIKKVHQALGKWHDYDVSLNYLQDFLYTHGIDPATEPYEALTVELRRRRQEYYDTIPEAFIVFNEVAVQI